MEQHLRTGAAATVVLAGVRSLCIALARMVLAVLPFAALLGHAASAQELRHGTPPPFAIGGELDLIDHHGAKFALSRLAGEPVLLFFGYTHCGSTCPIALAEARQVLHTLEPAPQAKVVFVTLDPLNDGPQQLREFVQRIHPRIVGLTGSPAQIERAAERYGVGVRQHGGTVEHSSVWYLLDGQARVRRVYAYTTPATELVADLRRLSAPIGAR